MSMMSPRAPKIGDDTFAHARELAAKKKCDVFLYNGGIEFDRDLDFMEQVSEKKKHNHIILILTTNGGAPDPAYKISRYLQEKYDSFSILISGACKSAGTLVCLGANELIFSPYGELGPLDIQIAKTDRVGQAHSGLVIGEALNALEVRAFDKFYGTVANIIESTNGIVSYPTAAQIAKDLVSQLYSPIFGQIDPEDLGERTRSMRIAADYGERLAIVGGNLKGHTLKVLTETYPSHSFVIDEREANLLFNDVRHVDELEQKVVSSLGTICRWQQGNYQLQPFTVCLSEGDDKQKPNREKTDGRKARRTTGRKGNGADSTGPAESPKTASGDGRSKRSS